MVGQSSFARVLMRRSRAVAASVARLVIYIEILHATEAGVDLDTNRKTPLGGWEYYLRRLFSLHHRLPLVEHARGRTLAHRCIFTHTELLHYS